MSHRSQMSIQHWLDLERSSERDIDAERALLEVFRFLPLASPSMAFLGRVVEEVRQSSDFFSRRWVRAAIVAGLVLLTFAIGMLPVSFIVLGKTFGLAAVVDLASRALLLLGDGIVFGLSVWGALTQLGEAASTLVATPIGIAALAVVVFLLVLSALLFRELLFRSPEVSS